MILALLMMGCSKSDNNEAELGSYLIVTASKNIFTLKVFIRSFDE